MEHLNFTIIVSQHRAPFLPRSGLRRPRPSGSEDLEPLPEFSPCFPMVTGLWPVLGAPVLSPPCYDPAVPIGHCPCVSPQEAADSLPHNKPHISQPGGASAPPPQFHPVVPATPEGTLGHLTASPGAAWLSCRARSHKPPRAAAYLPDADLCQLTVPSARQPVQASPVSTWAGLRRPCKHEPSFQAFPCDSPTDTWLSVLAAATRLGPAGATSELAVMC